MRSKTLFLLTALLMLPLLVFLQGCGDVEGDLNANQSPTVEFVNVHNNSDSTVYDIAPMIYWKGNDPDGFIEFYSYADITESAAIENPVEYIDRIPDEAWVDTIATQARVYLLSQEGDTTEHVFFLRAEDNSGAQSDVIFRRFHRTNQAPRIPMIGLTGTDEGEYGTRYVVEDTLFTAPSVTNIYPGIQFSWRGSDPDDKALFTVPLEYQAVLVKSPAETVFVNPWTDQVDIQLIDLQTGFYTLNVWARDDGLTRSVAPARAEFYVIRPTFEHNMLVVLESPIPGFNPVVSPPTRDAVRAYYEDLLAQVAPQLQFVNLDLNDGVDVRFVTTEVASDKIPRSLIHQYKLTLFIADHALPQGNFDAQNYIPEKEQVMEDYLRVGGRVWQMGRMLYKSGLHYEASNEMQLTLQDFFGVDSVAAPPNLYLQTQGVPYPQMRAEFIGTLQGLPNFPALDWDTSKAVENGFLIPPDLVEPSYYENNYGMSGVDKIARDETAQTTQYFQSVTAGTEVLVENEDAEVLSDDYPPTSTNAYLLTVHENVQEVESIINYTAQEDPDRQNFTAEPVVINDNLIFISYDEGQPWNDNDSLQVTYRYNPISVMHLKPVEVRKEGRQGGSVSNPFPILRYRTALSTFAYYFIEEQDAIEAWTLMLNWFYNPAVNDYTFDL